MDRPLAYMGIDPGADGAIVVCKQREFHCYNLSKLDDRDIWTVFGYWNGPEVRCMLEEIPTAIFGTGKSSMSKLYGSYKMLEAFLIAARIPYRTVKAVVWQSAEGLPKIKAEKSAAHKKRLLAHARERFRTTQLSFTITASNCDALMLADYSHMIWQYGKDGPI